MGGAQAGAARLSGFGGVTVEQQQHDPVQSQAVEQQSVLGQNPAVERLIRVVREAGKPTMYAVCVAGVIRYTPDWWQAQVFTQYY